MLLRPTPLDLPVLARRGPAYFEATRDIISVSP